MCCWILLANILLRNKTDKHKSDWSAVFSYYIYLFYQCYTHFIKTLAFLLLQHKEFKQYLNGPVLTGFDDLDWESLTPRERRRQEGGHPRTRNKRSSRARQPVPFQPLLNTCLSVAANRPSHSSSVCLPQRNENKATKKHINEY